MLGVDTLAHPNGSEPLAEPMLRMDYTTAGIVLSALHDETGAAIFASWPVMHVPDEFQPDVLKPVLMPLTRKEIEDLMLAVQGGVPATDFSEEYFGRRVNFIAEQNPQIITAFPASNGTAATYQPTEVALRIVKPAAGQLLKWASTSQLPLIHAWGALRTNITDNPDIAPDNSLLTSLVISSSLLRKPSTATRLAAAYPEITISNKSMANHLHRMANGGVAIKGRKGREQVFRLNPKHKPAIKSLLKLTRGMITYDPDFYYDGQRYAEELPRDDFLMRCLLKRVELGRS
jgi:hypothetical protein